LTQAAGRGTPELEQIVAAEAQLAAVVGAIAACNDAYFIGRAVGFPVALEGALKL